VTPAGSTGTRAGRGADAGGSKRLDHAQHGFALARAGRCLGDVSSVVASQPRSSSEADQKLGQLHVWAGSSGSAAARAAVARLRVTWTFSRNSSLTSPADVSDRTRPWRYSLQSTGSPRRIRRLLVGSLLRRVLLGQILAVGQLVHLFEQRVLHDLPVSGSADSSVALAGASTPAGAAAS